MNKLKVIISGGGTGGHIFPAVAIANELKRRLLENVDILFVGAQGRMEMERIPEAGYKIIGLPVQGFVRRLTLKNVSVLWKLWKSLRMARRVLKAFCPDVVVGVGGYAAGPLAWAATKRHIPLLLQEQNSYAGITNKLLSKKADKICVAYEGMERFFPKKNIVLTGNPVRQSIVDVKLTSADAKAFFGWHAEDNVVLSIGGSLGARTINQSIEKHLQEIARSKVCLIWQTGKHFMAEAREAVKAVQATNVFVTDFIAQMDMAYSAADLVISRAGAGTISELCLLGKPTILVPSPNVAEDHQTKNALALKRKNAAVVVPDSEAEAVLIEKALDIVNDADSLSTLAENIKQMALPEAAQLIVKEIVKLPQT